MEISRIASRLLSRPVSRWGISGSASKKSLIQAVVQDIAVMASETGTAMEDVRAGQ